MITALVVSAFAAGSIEDLDAKPGWRELKWGSAPTSDMVAGVPAVYTRPVEDLQIGNIGVSRIQYFYIDDELFSVGITAPAASVHDLLAAVESAFGPATERQDGRWTWHGDTVELDVHSTGLDPNRSYVPFGESDLQMSFRYLPIVEEYHRHIRERRDARVESAAQELK